MIRSHKTGRILRLFLQYTLAAIAVNCNSFENQALNEEDLLINQTVIITMRLSQSAPTLIVNHTDESICMCTGHTMSR